MLKHVLAPLFAAWFIPAPTADRPTAEDLQLRGSAERLDADCVRLTPDAPWASGSAWSKESIDLSEDFEVELDLGFGARDALGADGIVFVLAQQGQTGWRGEGMGFAGLRRSVGIEFDTYANRRQNDPQADHLALVLDGVPFHHPGTPVMTVPNLEDGQRHRAKISWSAENDALSVELDGAQRATYPGPIVRATLEGAERVVWGLTAGTGRKSNAHDVCFPKS